MPAAGVQFGDEHGAVLGEAVSEVGVLAQDEFGGRPAGLLEERAAHRAGGPDKVPERCVSAVLRFPVRL